MTWSQYFAMAAFDILHIGHMLYLEQARSWGDRLIVSVSADEYIRKIKPPPRPIQNEWQRSTQLSMLRCVNQVFICYDDTGALAIRGFRPQIFARGIDYRECGIDSREAEAVKEVGAEIRYTDTQKYASGDYVDHFIKQLRYRIADGTAIIERA